MTRQTKSEIFRTAHEIARREMKLAPAFYGNKYAAAFADALKAVYSERAYYASNPVLTGFVAVGQVSSD